MAYIFRGNLCGYICAECPEPLSNVKVRLYRSRPGQNVTVLAVASPKDTLTLLTDDAIKAKASSLLAETDTTADGTFTFELGQKENYTGEAFEIDVYCGTVPHQIVGPNPPPPRQFSITTLQPLWRPTETGYAWGWEYCVPDRFWCEFRGLFGARVICGRVTICDTDTPVAALKVTAFDADLLSDDPLGSGTTGSDGKFRIDYVHHGFLETVLPVLLPLFPHAAGADVHFRVEGVGGVILLDEPKSRGRQPDRDGVGPCFCVELCVTPGQIVPTPEQTPHWLQVEIFNVHASLFDLPHNILTEGYGGLATTSNTVGGDVALWGNCPLRNIAAPGDSLKFRFLIAEWGFTGGGDGTAGVMPSIAPPVPPSPPAPTAAWKIVPAGGGTRVGDVFYNDGVNPFQQMPVYVSSADQDADGWIQLDGKAITVPMSGGGTSTVFISDTNFLRSGLLMSMNSVAITSAHTSRLPAWSSDKTQAGRTPTPAEQEPIRRYGMIFQVRDASTNLDVFTDSLSSLVLDNSSPIVLLNLEELLANSCNPVSGLSAIHLRYTVDHPHLQYFTIEISNNSGTVHPAPPLPRGDFPPVNYFFRGDSSGPNPTSLPGGVAVTIAGDPVCAYAVILSWHTRRLYTGEGTTQVLYCK